MANKLAIDQYLANRLELGIFKFAPVKECDCCHNVRRIVHNDINTREGLCYDCASKKSADDAMVRGDLSNKFWIFMMSLNRYKTVEDLLYECDNSIDVRPPFPKDEIDDEED